MTPFAEIFTQTLSLLTLLGLVFTILLVFFRFFKNVSFFGYREVIFNFFSRSALPLAFLASFIGVIGSLVYSNVIGFSPCTLCWWARIFLYPQTILLFIALIKKNFPVKTHCLVFSTLGLITTAYHSYIQLGGNALLPCSSSSTNGAGGCDARYFIDYGFVTLPFMGLVAFLMIISFLLFLKEENQSSV